MAKRKRIGHRVSGAAGVDSSLATQAAEDRSKQLGREGGAINALKQAIALFDEDFGKGAESRALASASSSLISSGLGGTTRPGAVSAGLSAEFEDMRRGRMSSALSGLASFLGSYRDPTMATPGLVLQETEQDRRFALDQQRVNTARRGGTFRQPTFTPGPVSLAQPQTTQTKTSLPDTFTKSIKDFAKLPPSGNSLSGFDPAAANARFGNTLQTPATPDGNWFNWQDPLSFEGLNFG